MRMNRFGAWLGHLVEDVAPHLSQDTDERQFLLDHVAPFHADRAAAFVACFPAGPSHASQRTEDNLLGSPIRIPKR